MQLQHIVMWQVQTVIQVQREPGGPQTYGPDRYRSGPFVFASLRRGQLVDGGSVIGGSVDGGGLVVDPPVQCEIVTTALLCTGPV